MAAGLLLHGRMPLGEAARVGPYEIVESIGRGSMGDVYLARDSRLNRNVAIKVITADSGADDSKRRRFTQEARAASSLNHPNIVTVHDFGTEHGLSYIVSELIEGESLRSRIKRGPLPLKQLLDIAIQVTDGLAAAHEAGIIHRDLKPENILLTRDGRVKILDFGLAKPFLEEHLEGATLSGETLDEVAGGTEPGLILGTVGYMSPEQARGAPVGPQSDQFSLGILLHEMATGHPPFHGATPMETLLHIANVQRPPFTPGPVAFRLLVARCLARDPEKRFPHTAEIAERLRHIREQLPDSEPKPATGPQAPAAPIRGRWWQRISPRVVVAVLAMVALAAAAMLAAWRYLAPGLGDPLAYSFSPLASDSEIEMFPAWSPNGRVIAYAAESEGTLQLFTRGVRSPLSTQVTRSAADCFFPFWSPDGTRIYYVSTSADKPSLWVVNATGGAPELVSANVAGAAISPDGKTLATLRGDGPLYGLWLASPPGSAPKQVESNPFRSGLLASTILRFTPDSKTLGVWASLPAGNSEFWTVPLGGGSPARHFDEPQPSGIPVVFSWLPDGERVLFSAPARPAGNDHLWAGNIRTGNTRLITTGTGSEQWPAVAPSGSEAALASADQRYELMQIELGDSAAPEPVLRGAVGASWPSWSPISDEFAFATAKTGAPEIHLRNAASNWERTLVSARDFEDGTTAMLSDICFSPNGQSIAYVRTGGGREDIWISSISGEPPVRLANEPNAAVERWPTWSPDGNWIAYASLSHGRFAVKKARVGVGSPPVIVRESAGTDPQWSPRGDYIAAIAREGGLNLFSPDGTNFRHVGRTHWLAITWTHRGSRVLGLERSDDRHLALAWLDPASGEETRLADLGRYPPAFAYGELIGAAPVEGMSVARDSRTLATSLLQLKSGLWLLDGLAR